MWYVACQSPVPAPPQVLKGRGILMLGSPAIYKVRPKKGESSGPLPVYWKGNPEKDGRHVYGDEWISDPSCCQGYETKGEAEQVAFDLVAKRSELLGHLYVTSL